MCRGHLPGFYLFSRFCTVFFSAQLFFLWLSLRSLPFATAFWFSFVVDKLLFLRFHVNAQERHHCYQCAVIMNFMLFNEIPINFEILWLLVYEIRAAATHIFLFVFSLSPLQCVCCYWRWGRHCCCLIFQWQTLSRHNKMFVMWTSAFVTSPSRALQLQSI